MTKSTGWLIAAAASALIAGSGMALGQGMPQGGGGVSGGGMSGGGMGGSGGGAVQGGTIERGGGVRGGAEGGGAVRGSERGTTGQAAPSGGMQSERPQAQEPGGATREQRRGGAAREGAQERQRSTTGQNGSTREGAQQRERGAGTNDRASVNLSTQQRTRIRNVVVRDRSIRHVNNVNVNIAVGAFLPSTVALVDVPEDVVAIFPRFRRHKIVIIRDEIVIVEPSTLRIVAVLPA